MQGKKFFRTFRSYSPRKSLDNGCRQWSDGLQRNDRRLRSGPNACRSWRVCCLRGAVIQVGHIYIVSTNLTRPPKDKITLCICSTDNYFLWFNSEARIHGVGQFIVTEADHVALTKNSYLDCSQVTTFPPGELASAQPRGVISRTLAKRLQIYLNANPPRTLPPAHHGKILTMIAALL